MLRPYQAETVQSIYDHLRARTDNPCAVLPTGSGKTHVIKQIAEDCVDNWGGRVLILAHVKELLEQARTKLAREDVGIYSAGLNSRDTDQPIIIAGIQSVYKRAGELGPFNLVIVDEAHLIPDDGEGMYRRFIADTKLVNPKTRIIGLTATPYRMKTGMICGPDSILNHVCHEVSIPDLIVQGYLSSVRSKAGKKKLDLSELHVRGGEFIAEEIDRLMDDDKVVDAAVSDIIANTEDRASVLVFAASVKHAMHLQTLLPGAGLITGDTPKSLRAEQIAEFKAGEMKYLVSVNVLSIGFDAPNVDCVALLRPTLSPGLYYQQIGRGLRVDGVKEDCLVLDFVGNIKQHGPIDVIRPANHATGGGGDNAVTKECTQCNELVAAAYRVCPQCGFEFPANDSLKHGSKAAEDDAVLSEQEKPAVWEVRDVRYSAHTKKNADESAPKTLRIDYFCGVGMRFSRWVCVEHSGFAHGKALEWWKENSNDPFPEDAQHAADICNAGGVALVETVTVRYEGKWPRIIGATTGSLPAPLEDFARHNEEEIPF